MAAYPVSVTLDSRHPGLMGITVHEPWDDGQNVTVYLTREQARQFGIDVLATSEQGFMRAEPNAVVADPGPPDGETGQGECLTCGQPALVNWDYCAMHTAGEDDASVAHEHPYADELHLGGG